MPDKFKVGDLVQFVGPKDHIASQVYAEHNIKPMAVAFIVRLEGDGVPVARFLVPIKEPLRSGPELPSNCFYILEDDFTLLKAAEDE